MVISIKTIREQLCLIYTLYPFRIYSLGLGLAISNLGLGLVARLLRSVCFDSVNICSNTSCTVKVTTFLKYADKYRFHGKHTNNQFFKKQINNKSFINARTFVLQLQNL